MEQGAKMFEFFGWNMPLSYRDTKSEYFQTRNQCSLFDISHMLQIKVTGKDRIKFIEKLVVSDIQEIPANKAKLTIITNSDGGIEEDLILVNNDDESLNLIHNACNADKIKKLFNQEITKNKSLNCHIEYIERGLISIQGPGTDLFLSKIPEYQLNGLRNLKFMDTLKTKSLFGFKADFLILRCGYTGEDGIEISIPKESCLPFVNVLRDKFMTGYNSPTNKLSILPAGFITRDILRLEAGLCLYGNDIDKNTNPIQSLLAWTIGKRRLAKLDFTGSDRISSILRGKSSLNGNKIVRRGLIAQLQGNYPIPRHGHLILSREGDTIGHVTSGNISPIYNKNVAMGYIEKKFTLGHTVYIPTSSKKLIGYKIIKLPFVTTKYKI